MNKVVPRYLYPCGEDIFVDADGLLITDSSWFRSNKLLDDAAVANLPGGMLLAEGGMGKTIFMRQLKQRLPEQEASLIQLGEYHSDIDGFQVALESCLDGIPKGVAHTLILDSLDEASELAGVVLRIIRVLPPEISVWIASRDVAAIRSIQAERSNIAIYNLAPLSPKDICTLAFEAGADGIKFLEAARQQGIAGICAKPLGCALAISVFKKNGLIGVKQGEIWRQGVERLCDETPSSTRNLRKPCEYTLSQIIDCSEWISLCLALTGRTCIWTGEQSYCPPQSLGLSEVVAKEVPLKMIRETLGRGVFRPGGDGRIWPAHDLYFDYLAAHGFFRFIPSTHWHSLLLGANRTAVFPQRTGIATWLAAWNEGFLEDLVGIQPELLLASVDAMEAIGSDKVCEALLYRVESLSWQQRHCDAIDKNLKRLKGKNTPTILNRVLSDMTASSPATETAERIAVACEYSELSDILATRVLNLSLGHRDRVEAAYAVCALNNELAKARLKTLLPIDPAQDHQDDLRGLVLRACWPNHLTPSEIVQHLLRPQNENLLGAYRVFLEYELLKFLPTVVDTSNDYGLLAWAVSHITENQHSSSLGNLARPIFSAYWKCATKPSVAVLLAKGYEKALLEYKSPFIEKGKGLDNDTPPILARDAFLKDADGRFAILEIILSGAEIKNDKINMMSVFDYPLFTPDDLPQLFSKVLCEPSGSLAPRWVACINAVIYRCDLGGYAKEIDQIHDLRPDLADSYETIKGRKEAGASQAKDYEQQWKDEEAGRKTKGLSAQSQIDREIKRFLQNLNSKPDIFPKIAAWINSENGVRKFGSIDIQESTGWKKLDEEERTALIELAERYLRDVNIPPTEPNRESYAPAQAFVLIQRLRPATYEGFGEDVWRKCSKEILKTDRDDSIELMAPLFDTLARRFPGVAEEAVIDVIRQQISRGYITILKHWGDRFSDTQAMAVMQMVGDSATSNEQRVFVLEELVRRGKSELVRNYLDELFNMGWDKPPTVELHRLRMLAFQLSPNRYIGQVLGALSKDREWGRQWIESVIGIHDERLLTAFSDCSSQDVASLYAWLHREYPASTCPNHDDGQSYAPTALDEIHHLKSNHLLNHLSSCGKPGSSEALKWIFQQFPEDVWIQNCILEARSAEQANACPVLSVPQIQKLAEQKSASRCLINSIQDLHDLLNRTLQDYQRYLQGDNPAVKDLWETMPLARPRDEEYISDHLVRYLTLRLKTDVVINREVQIRRKLYKEGLPGSRTDVWIQALNTEGGTITLCIEVKCNWNPSARNAIKDQLINKYLKGGTANGGLLLLGWFECASWDPDDDKRAKSTRIWANLATARAELEAQVIRERKANNMVSQVILDCGLR